MTEATLGRTIRTLREGIGMSQAQLASCAGLSQGYLSQIENDEVQHPSAAVLFRLAEALHVDPRSLLQASGFRGALTVGEGTFEPPVDPDLLRFLARMSAAQQRHLLRLLEALGKGARPIALANGGGRRERAVSATTRRGVKVRGRASGQ